MLEIGFGSGLNLPYFPGEVSRLIALDPAEVGRKLGAERIAEAPFDVEFVGLDAARLPLEDDSVDTVLSTFTLCTVPDVEQALQEVRRVLRPGGTFHVLEHGLAGEPSVARWQQRLNGVQRCVFGGCNLNRHVRGLLEGAGFRTGELQSRYLEKTPKPLGYVTYGRRALA